MVQTTSDCIELQLMAAQKNINRKS